MASRVQESLGKHGFPLNKQRSKVIGFRKMEYHLLLHFFHKRHETTY